MKSFKPTIEFHCPSPTRSGTIKLIHNLLELGVCSYWSDFEWMWEECETGIRAKEDAAKWIGTWSPLVRHQEVVTFREPIGVSIDHAYVPKDFTSKIIRTIRDPRDAGISNYLRNVKQSNKPEFYTPEEYLNTPLPKGQGGVFQLGHIEEWVLQELWLQKLIPIDRRHYLPMELMRSSGEDELRKLASYLGITRTDEEIRKAIEATKSENFSKTPEEALKNHFRWKKGEFPEFQKRFALVASVLGNPHENLYPADTQNVHMSKITWPQEIWEAAAKEWCKRTVIRLTEQLPTADHTVIMQDLFALCTLIEDLPLIEFHLLQVLIQNNAYQEFTTEKVSKLNTSPYLFIRLLSSILGAQLSPPKESNVLIAKECIEMFSGSPWMERMTKLSLEALAFNSNLLFDK